MIILCINLPHGTLNTPKLNEQAKLDLEKGYKSEKTHAYRKRCLLVLLKSENRKSKEVADILKTTENSVNLWVSRYKNEGKKVSPDTFSRFLKVLAEDIPR